jgi:protein-L-isoaspartate(D-aspartate) O-methyltransferase
MTAFDFEQARFNMIEQQIRPWEVLDTRVLDIMLNTPREAFVPEKYRRVAFTDTEIPLGHDQTMMPPKLEGRLLQALQIKPSDAILEIGTGSGYVTACLAKLGQSVTSVEYYQDFIDQAKQALRQHDIHNVTLQKGDAGRGWSDRTRYDVVAVTGSLPELHRGFHNCLAIGGRLFVIVGRTPVMEALVFTRVAEDQWHEESLLETCVAPLVNAEPPPKFTL